MGRPSSLRIHPTKLVHDALRKNSKPLTAYQLLEKLKKHGIKAAPIIYRALETLTKEGKVHRIIAQNAYVACDCPPNHSHEVSVLTVCQGCDEVNELHDHAVIHHLTHLRDMKINVSSHAVIELPVTCESCAI